MMDGSFKFIRVTVASKECTELAVRNLGTLNQFDLYLVTYWLWKLSLDCCWEFGFRSWSYLTSIFIYIILVLALGDVQS